jgi:flagellar basal-body rod modification protein FlgD
MSLSGPLQTKIAPPQTPAGVTYNQLEVATPNKAKDANEEPKVEFRSLLQNSNADLARERSAKKTGDLSGAKNDQEFFDMLNQKNNPVRTPKNVLGKDDFLKLFVAQLQNQDPMNPSDSTEMAAQLAQFNGLEQMMNVNKNLEAMMKQQGGDRTVGMINYVDKEVTLDNGRLKFDKGKTTKAVFEINTPVAGAFLEVRDDSGSVISQQELGSLMPGEHNLKWHGKTKDNKDANPGIYHFSIIGKNLDGQDVPIAITSKVKVSGVDMKEEGGAFFTELGKVKFKDVSSVGLQGFSKKTEEVTLPPAAAMVPGTQFNPLTGQPSSQDSAMNSQGAQPQPENQQPPQMPQVPVSPAAPMIENSKKPTLSPG